MAYVPETVPIVAFVASPLVMLPLTVMSIKVNWHKLRGVTGVLLCYHGEL